MKLDFVIRELYEAEVALAHDLEVVAGRHRAEHEVHHVALDLAGWSREHVRRLADLAASRGIDLPEERKHAAEPVTHDDQSVQLLADLRGLHRATAGVSLDWELLAQGAQAVKDTHLLKVASSCHPRTLRQLTWTNGMLKQLSPQVLAS